MKHSCDKELNEKYPTHSQALDGERWACSCGRVWEHVCDEAEGCCWVPRVERERPDKTARRVRRTRLRHAAQRVDR
jgi:hypothetical protein